MIKPWIASLNLFSPARFIKTVTEIGLLFIHSTRTFIALFYHLILIDLFFIGAFYKLLSAPYKNAALPQTFVISTLLLLWSINWFLLRTSYFISVTLWKKNVSNIYYADRTLRYAQLSLLVPLVVLAGILIFSFIGITHYPKMPWYFAISGEMLGSIIMFFWLDSLFSFTDILKSLDQGTNLFLYNLPLFIVILGTKVLLGATLIHFLVEPIFNHFSLFGPIMERLQFFITPSLSESLVPALFHTLLLRYLALLLDGFITSFLFTAYSEKKSVSYSSQLFE